MLALAARARGVVCDSTPVQTTALRGLMASLASTGASLWRAMSMRDRPAGGARAAPAACAALCGAAGGRRAAADVVRLLVAIGRCAAPRIGAARRRRRGGSVRPNTTLAATRRHPWPHGDIRVVPGWWPLTALGFARAPNWSWRSAALNDQQKMPPGLVAVAQTFNERRPHSERAGVLV